ncbi:MAG: PD40 domain-containing protein [Sphingobacteriales bacterium]|nr:PD40 domain-containing protein [Sphingobacteriales bacterium]MBI3718777.1 PD40 domain-containing protein [Sphingobacteriales bacterium]
MRKALVFCGLFLPLLIYAQSGSEIYLAKLTVTKNQISIAAPKNISNHKGYDSQPFFHPSQPLIYYASFNDSGRSDIKAYNYQTNITKNFTTTEEREYSPTVTPDGKYISCIIQRDNGAQDLGKYPINGGTAEVIINYMVVGYHSWIDDKSLLLFVLDDTAHNSLHYFNVITKEDVVMVQNPGRSLHKIPNENAMSFVEKVSDDGWLIQKFDIKTRTISTITKTLPKREDLCWLNNGTMLMSDGEKLFSFDPKKDKEWMPVKVQSSIPLKGISRIIVNKANNKIAIVAAE